MVWLLMLLLLLLWMTMMSLFGTVKAITAGGFGVESR